MDSEVMKVVAYLNERLSPVERREKNGKATLVDTDANEVEVYREDPDGAIRADVLLYAGGADVDPSRPDRALARIRALLAGDD